MRFSDRPAFKFCMEKVVYNLEGRSIKEVWVHMISCVGNTLPMKGTVSFKELHSVEVGVQPFLIIKKSQKLSKIVEPIYVLALRKIPYRSVFSTLLLPCRSFWLRSQYSNFIPCASQQGYRIKTFL